MEVRFDAKTAQALIESICKYCSSIQKDAKDVLQIVGPIKEWNDPQYHAFCDSIQLICSDLDKTLKLESDYLTVFQTRVDELRR